MAAIMGPTAAHPQAVPAPATQLTSEEVGELTAFAEGKAKIEVQITLLEAIQPITPFGGFESMAGGSSSIAAAEALRPYTLEDVQRWQAERDSIERHADAFQAHDMAKLRSLATQSVSRPMSPRDTDLVELALQTLYSLDKLLILLRARQETLDVLAVRAEWEEARSASWARYYALEAEVDEIVRTKAQWLQSAGDAPCEPSESSAADVSLADSSSGDLSSAQRHQSPSKTSAAAKASLAQSIARGQALQADIVVVRGGIGEWADTAVGAASRAMDAMIDHGKIPDALLDEQDRLEDLVEDLHQRLEFLVTLSLQWSRCDDLLARLRGLQQKARLLAQDAATAKAELDPEDVARVTAKGDALRAELAQLCGSGARRFLADGAISSRSLSFEESFAPPMPLLPAHPGQREANEAVAQFLQRELTSAAKKTRQACSAATEVAEAQTALLVFEEQLVALQSLAEEADSLSRDACALQAAIASAAADVPDADHSQEAPRWASEAQRCSQALEQLQAKAVRINRALAAARDLSIDKGVTQSKLARREGSTRDKVQAAEAAAQEAVQSASRLYAQMGSLVTAGAAARDARLHLRLFRACLENLPSSSFPTSAASLASWSCALDQAAGVLQAEMEAQAQQALSGVDTDALDASLHPAAQGALSQLRDVLSDWSHAMRRLAWERARHKQAAQVQEVSHAADALTARAARLSPGGDMSKPLSDEVLAFSSSLVAAVDLIGPAPVQEGYPQAADTDGAVRAFLNGVFVRLEELRARLGGQPDAQKADEVDAAAVDSRPIEEAGIAEEPDSAKASATVVQRPVRTRTTSIARLAHGARGVTERVPASATLPTSGAGGRRLSSVFADATNSRLPRSPVKNRASSRLTSTSSMSSQHSSRASSPSSESTHSGSGAHNSYRADPRSKLDVAVGKVVNRLQVSISVRSATAEHAAAPGYQDETGYYLLSNPVQPQLEPKLVFCRILRSGKTMCRIGGGWQELGSFIMQKFAGPVDIHQTFSTPATVRSVSWSSREQSPVTIDIPTTAATTLTPVARRIVSDSAPALLSTRRGSSSDESSPAAGDRTASAAPPTPTPAGRRRTVPAMRAASDSRIEEEVRERF